jgi:hypothetical protein
MKVEKYILTALCAAVCLWSGKLAVGVILLAVHQGPRVLLGLLEVAMFLGVGAIPIALVWWRKVQMRPLMYVIWIVCVSYVLLISLNYARVDLLGAGIRLLVGSCIVVLFTRARHAKSA